MFYNYRQNNSGGSFIVNNDVTINVIIEANSPQEADARAENIGIYFDGCANDQDCECCGDRWSRIWCDGDESPMIYGESPENHANSIYNNWTDKDEPYCHVYYLDGTKKTYSK